MWRLPLVQRNCYSLVEGARYTAPWRLIGEEVEGYVDEIFASDDVLCQLTKVQAIVRHLETFPIERARGACRRASFYGSYSYIAIKNILKTGLDLEPLPSLVLPASDALERPRFARNVQELLDFFGRPKRCTQLTNSLKSSRNCLARLGSIDLLIIDDLGLGLRELTCEEPLDLYDIIRQRYERASTIITSSRAVEEWAPLFRDPLLASAAIDRLRHHAHIIEITGDSYRNPPPRKAA